MKKSVAEERLKESEERYALIAHETGQLIYDYDIATGTIEWGGAIEEVTGFPPKEFPSGIRDWEDMIHPEDRALTVEILASARKTGRRFQAEYRFRTRGGGYRHIRVVGVFVKGRSGKVARMIGSMTDITDRKKAEAALENSLSLLRATLESTADGILVVDRGGLAQTMNQTFIDMWNIPAEVARTRDDARILDSVLAQLRDPEAFVARVKRLYARPSEESFDVIAFKDGRVFERMSRPQRIKNRIIGRVWSFRDITKRKRAEDTRAAVYRISEIANAAESLGGLFRSLHEIIGGLMPARNFYIAMYDDQARMLSFPYFMDEVDEPPGPEPLGRGLTDYVLRTGEPLLADPAKFLELERSGDVESIGAPSIDWLGVPLKVQDKTIGAMVVQTYTEGVRYRPEDMDILVFVSTQAALAIERKRAEETLRESEEKYRAILEQAADAVFIHDETGRIIDVNRKACQNLGYSREEMLSKSIGDIDPNAIQEGEDKSWNAILGGETRTFESRQMRKDGSALSVEVMLGSVRLHQGPVILGIVRDITDRKQAEKELRASLQEKEVLLKEIHHRVKNNMQVISSLLSLQSSHLTDPKAIGMFKDSQHRIRSMALVHEKLYQSKDLSRIDFRQYLENLVVYLVHSYLVDSARVGLKIDVGDVLLDINTAIPCGLIVNELATNALKHAFPGDRKGEVRVTFRPEGDHRFTLTVGDNGIGFPPGVDFRKTDTLGLQLVTMLVDQLDGTIELRAKKGTEYRIKFAELKYHPRI